MKPLDKIENVAEDEAIVFYVYEPDDGKPVLMVEVDEEKAMKVFEQYYALLLGNMSGDEE